MEQASKLLFYFSAILSGTGCCIFSIMGYLDIIPLLPAIIGAILFLFGVIASICDHVYWQNNNTEFFSEYDYISRRNKWRLTEMVNTLLKQLPLKRFSPGQALLLLFSILIFIFIISVILIQAIYDINVFTKDDLRLGAFVNLIVLLVYVLFYVLAEIYGKKSKK